MSDPNLAAPNGALAGRASLAVAWPRERELREWVVALTGGDAAAMARLYDATHRIVFTLVQRLLGDRDLAEEVLLDVFVQVWRRGASFDAERGTVPTWLLAIARSRALDRKRTLVARADRECAWSDELAESASERSRAHEPLAVHCSAERGGAVRAAIARLPEGQREAVALAFFGGLSHSEIAARTGAPLGTVKTRIRLALVKLKDELRSLEEVE